MLIRHGRRPRSDETNARLRDEENKAIEDSEFEAYKQVVLELWKTEMTPQQRLRVVEARTEDDIGSLGRDLKRVELTVLETFGGEFDDAIVLRTGLGSGDCGLDLREGRTYLVQAYRKADGFWSSSICSSTGDVAFAFGAENLKALRAWKSDRKTLSKRIYGRAENWTELQDEDGQPGMGSLPVRLIGGNEPIETVTDAEGNFLFEDLKPGSYRIETGLSGWSYHSHTPSRIDLMEQQCAAVVFEFQQHRGAIQGRLLPQPGESLPHYLRFFAIPITAEGKTSTAFVELDGSFSADSLEPGSYHVRVAVGEDGNRFPGSPEQQDPDWPHPPLYYPGVSTIVQAAVFQIARGQTIELTDWILPPSMNERRLTGQVIWPPGTKGDEAEVGLFRPGTDEWIAATYTTGEETFELYVLEGVPYEVRAMSFDGMRLYEGRVTGTALESPMSIPLAPLDDELTEKRFEEFLKREQ